MVIVFEKLHYCNTTQKSQYVLITEIGRDNHLINSSSYHVIVVVVQEGLRSHMQSFPVILRLYAYSDTCLFIPHDTT